MKICETLKGYFVTHRSTFLVSYSVQGLYKKCLSLTLHCSTYFDCVCSKRNLLKDFFGHHTILMVHHLQKIVKKRFFYRIIPGCGDLLPDIPVAVFFIDRVPSFQPCPRMTDPRSTVLFLNKIPDGKMPHASTVGSPWNAPQPRQVPCLIIYPVNINPYKCLTFTGITIGSCISSIQPTPQ